MRDQRDQAVRKSLGQYNIAPSIDFANEISLDIQKCIKKMIILKTLYRNHK